LGKFEITKAAKIAASGRTVDANTGFADVGLNIYISATKQQ
jgi:hypothetical protein